ncbi:DUF3277 family protein [Parablautia intestinalis]|uniref:DUF3277 family protein n=1 Tax=Parablautia intestinalis TaxID=2320100 RepID=A0A3A9ASA9_9FIRM|nr:phage protein [Parablautia intestinalis]RKI90433.1 DUF3277 family protein [Parablautia intestinalis]
MDGLFTYNPAMVKAALGTHMVTGYAEDTFITIEEISQGTTSKTGCDGETVRSVDPNTRFSVKLTLQMGSPTHKYLLNRYNRDKKDGNGSFPILINDLTGKEKFSAINAWVTKLPTNTKGKEGQNKEWTLETGQADFQIE